MSSKKTQYKSEAYAAIHETMDSLHQVGTIDKKTMRGFDDSCLKTVPDMEPKDIRALCLPSVVQKIRAGCSGVN